MQPGLTHLQAILFEMTYRVASMSNWETSDSTTSWTSRKWRSGFSCANGTLTDGRSLAYLTLPREKGGKCPPPRAGMRGQATSVVRRRVVQSTGSLKGFGCV